MLNIKLDQVETNYIFYEIGANNSMKHVGRTLPADFQNLATTSTKCVFINDLSF